MTDAYQANDKSCQATYHQEGPAGHGGCYDQRASSFPSWDNQQIYFNEDGVTDSEHDDYTFDVIDFTDLA
eukprot:2940282-Heterocapsa_arctica.AAC.1